MIGDKMDKYWYWLVSIEDMWFDKIRKSMEKFENPEEIYRANENSLIKSGIFHESDIFKIKSSKEMFDIEKEMELLEKKNIKITYYGKNDYPDKLKHYEDKPYALFYKGQLPVEGKNVAIVGARNCSSYGREVSEHIAFELAKCNVSIISGMARGTDKYAHIGCIKGGAYTYAVLGCGVDVCYPKENIEIYTQIQKMGGLISEYPPKSAALAWRFPYRNRIISMLSDVVVVVEAKEKSGTFITVDYALAYGKDVFAVPGRITDELSLGCNRLIKTGAYPYISMEDLKQYLKVDENKIEIKNNFILEKEFEVVYSCLCLHPVGVEEIVQMTGYKVSKVYEILMKLKINRMAEEVFSGHYIKKLQ